MPTPDPKLTNLELRVVAMEAKNEGAISGLQMAVSYLDAHIKDNRNQLREIDKKVDAFTKGMAEGRFDRDETQRNRLIQITTDKARLEGEQKALREIREAKNLARRNNVKIFLALLSGIGAILVQLIEMLR